MTDRYDVVIVGGGAAGLNAALVLARARRSVAVVDGGSPRNAPAGHLHGFLSRDGLPPAELLRAGREEVAGYGGDLVDDVVSTLRPDRLVELASGRVLAARRVLVATGLTDELPEIPGVRERWGHDVLHCPYCHGWEVRDRPLAVLGTSPRSPHQALLVRQWSADLVYFPHTAEPAREDAERMRARGIRIVPGKVDEVVVEGDRVRAVRLADGTEVAREAVFVGPRFVPKDGVLAAAGCARAESGFVAVDGTGRTSVPWLWAAGNVVDPAAQLITAASDGARAAADINLDLVLEPDQEADAA
ncbi:thioredoxin reductase [Prauserella shujinwangii]|uniref:Thioredoxin reductase n=1 Tax=Prauserella shujinwangii TaxID=1453103 RepID=A0A2T0M022_9PSEU|nr:NAD(P)/FAD-dependent oxidoreductase [Prauserella shujinwangii]PRX49953.1 thioredoxin reductase [Prauserella shujinwangii]